MKALLVANTDWYLYNFRRALAHRLQQSGYEVTLVCPPGRYVDKLRNLGFKCVLFNLPVDRLSSLSTDERGRPSSITSQSDASCTVRSRPGSSAAYPSSMH